MCNIEEARCNGLKILIPKHMRKSKNELLEQISAKNPYVTFFLGHPVHIQCGIGDLCQHKIYMLGYSMLAKVIYVEF